MSELSVFFSYFPNRLAIYIKLALLYLIFLLSGCHGNDSDAPIAPAAEHSVVVSIQLTPMQSAIPIGISLSFTATAIYTDNTTEDVTNRVVWSSSDNAIALINQQGQATGIAVGAVKISAVYGDAVHSQVTAEAILSVKEAVLNSLQITPQQSSVARGLHQQFTAIATFSDHSTMDLTHSAVVTWSSSAPGVATIGNQVTDNGLATGVSEGTTTISQCRGTTPWSALQRLGHPDRDQRCGDHLADNARGDLPPLGAASALYRHCDPVRWYHP